MKKLRILFYAGLVLFIGCEEKEDPIPEPVSEFSADQVNILVGASVQFSDESTNSPTGWTWTFEGGDPSSSNDQNPQITYSESGNYDVTLEVANSTGTSTETKSDFITVHEKLDAVFVSNDTIIDEGATVTFTSESQGIPTNWNWSFEGGTPSESTSESPSVTYNSPGVYDVSLEITNDIDSDEIVIEAHIIVLPTSGLIAYYPFNGDADDSSGNNLHGEVNGATLVSDRNGTTNSAYTFDGVDDRIEVENNSLMENQKYSISVWINAENNTGAIISMSDFDPVQNNCGYYLSILDGNLRGLSNIGTSNWARNVDDETISLNEWHHVVFTYDGTNLELYQNGESISSLSQSHTVNYSESNPIQIGTYKTNSGETIFKGSIDDIRIFDRALSIEEVIALSKE